MPEDPEHAAKINLDARRQEHLEALINRQLCDSDKSVP
jgi:hypothetical protein